MAMRETAQKIAVILILTAAAASALTSSLSSSASSSPAQPRSLQSLHPYQATSLKQRRESLVGGIQLHKLTVCPPECRCFSKVVHCEGDRLSVLPETLPIDTERITIAHSSISRLDKKSFDRLPGLIQIVLSHNKIRDIERGTFQGLRNLQYLDLRQNLLKCLHEGTFDRLNNLRVLKLDHNQISWMSSVVFRGLPALQWISLSNNPLRCECHLAALMRDFVNSNRRTVFASAGAVCDPSGANFPGMSALEAMPLLYCPTGASLPPPPPPETCSAAPSQSSRPSCETVCSCDTSGFVSCAGQGLTRVPHDLPPNMISLNLAENRFTRLPEKSFSGYPSLRKLNLEGNQIHEISPNAFEGLERLLSLYLTSNKIRGLQSGTFEGMSALTILYLQKNNITCIGEGFFDGLHNLRILHLSNNQIEKIDQTAFTKLKQLKFLYLVDNSLRCDCSLAWLSSYLKVTEVDGSRFATCSSPTDLRGQLIRDVDLRECPAGVKKYPCPRTTPLAHQPPTQMEDPYIAQDCPKGCTCTQIPSRVQRSTGDVFTFTAVRPSLVEQLEPSLKVECSGAGLTSFPIGVPENTKELYLQHNSITDLSQQNFVRLSKLEVLSLHHNKLSCIRNHTFAHLPKLKVLLLHTNNLRCLGSAAFNINTLKTLSLDENPFMCGSQLSWIIVWMQKNQHLLMPSPEPPACSGPPHLRGKRIASLSKSQMTCGAGNATTDLNCENSCCFVEQKEIDQPITCPPACSCKNQRVDCSGRSLKDIPANLPVNTRDLFLEHNEIVKIEPKRLQNLKHLETLLLSYNSILELQPGTFEGLENLRSLVLSSNKLRCLHPDAFNGLKQLRVLILQNNDISTLSNVTFRDLKQLNNLALGQNPLHCDCNLRWLNVFFHAKFLDNGVALCSSPRSMKQKSVFHTSTRDFKCSRDADSLSRYRRSFPDEEDEIAAKCMPCVSNPCQNNGKCDGLTGLEYRCRCEAPFFGNHCEQKMDACFGKPCKNGGLCEIMHTLGHYQCKCPPGFRGTDCEENIDDCQDVCQNGGTCLDGVNNYTCQCPAGYNGQHCENVVKYCVEYNPCMNSGLCTAQGVSGFLCICPDGWVGEACSEKVNNCEYNKCENSGICRDELKGYSCECQGGFSGKFCEKEPGESSISVRKSAEFGCQFNRCQNGASCKFETSNLGYFCNCRMGYGGVFCEKLLSVSLTTRNSHVTITAPHLGSFSPRGNVSLSFATKQQYGVLLFFSEDSSESFSSRRRFFATEVYRGHIKLSFSLGPNDTAVAYSIAKVNDEVTHRIDVIVAGNIAELFVDGNRNALIQSAVPNATTNARHLVARQPIFIGGASSEMLAAAQAAGLIRKAHGLIACIRNLHINGKAAEFTLNDEDDAKSSGIAAGCPSNPPDTPPKKGHLGIGENHVPTDTAQSDSEISATAQSPGDCRNASSGCLNGGVCVPGFAMPQNGALKLSGMPQQSGYVCKCPRGYDGVMCENLAYCRRYSHYSYLHDPDTGCISTSRVVVMSCSGTCTQPSSSLLWYREQQKKRQLHNKSRRRIRRHRQQWTPSLLRSQRSPGDGGCCQPIRFKQQNVQFHCPQSPTGRVYSREFRFVRKCGCAACDSSNDTKAGDKAVLSR